VARARSPSRADTRSGRVPRERQRERNAAANTSTPIEPLSEYFRGYGIPPSWLHEALQRAAMQAGWIPPSYGEEQRSKKREAGKRSGRRRGALRRCAIPSSI
jgi:hypothetical protein